MTDAIGPKMFVICISESQNRLQDPSTPKNLYVRKGQMYFVEALSTSKRLCPTDGCGHIGLFLKGMEYRGYRILYCPNKFKPLGGDEQIEETQEKVPPIRICEPA